MGLNKTVAGIKWSVLISIFSTISFLLSNLILAKIDKTSNLVGQFAAVIIAFNLTLTFLFLGSSNVIIHYFHKTQRRLRNSFLKFHLRNLVVFSTIVISFFAAFPNFLLWVNELFNFWVLLLILPQIIYSFISSFEMARMNYRKGIILDKLHHVVLLSLTFSFLFASYVGIVPSRVFEIYVCGVVVLFILVIWSYKKLFVSIFRSRKDELEKKEKFGYLKYLLLTQCNAILAFLFMYLDQLIIGKKLGLGHMGIFFFFSQIALMVKYIAMQFNKTLLSSFSAIVAKGKSSELDNLYFFLFKNIILVSLMISLAIFFFAKDLLVFVNPNYLLHVKILYVLITANLLGALGSINSMLVVSLNKLTSFLILNLLIGILNIVLVLNVKSDFMINFAQVKIPVVVFGQIGLFFLVRDSVVFNWKKICFGVVVLLVSVFISSGIELPFFSRVLLFALIAFGILKNLRSDLIKKVSEDKGVPS